MLRVGFDFVWIGFHAFWCGFWFLVGFVLFAAVAVVVGCGVVVF